MVAAIILIFAMVMLISLMVALYSDSDNHPAKVTNPSEDSIWNITTKYDDYAKCYREKDEIPLPRVKYDDRWEMPWVVVYGDKEWSKFITRNGALTEVERLKYFLRCYGVKTHK